MSQQPSTASPAPILTSVPGAARILSMSRSRIYELIAEQRIRSVKDKRRRLIVIASLHEFAATLTDGIVAPVQNGGWK